MDKFENTSSAPIMVDNLTNMTNVNITTDDDNDVTTTTTTTRYGNLQ